MDKINFYRSFGVTHIVTASIIISVIFSLLLVSPSAKAQKNKEATKSDTISQEIASITTSGQFVYGKSGQGNDLICYKISPNATNEIKSKILMTFEIHGFEDLSPKDGQKMTEIGKYLVQYFESNRDLMNAAELYIITSANPDGLLNGVTENGLGRCQISSGIDINRDFDYDFKPNQTGRYHTLDKPFSSPESKALKDLVGTIHPTIVIDCHGWDDLLLGDPQVAKCFPNLPYDGGFTSDNDGFFSAWAGTKGSKALLLEYPQNAYYDIEKYEKYTASGIESLIGAN